MTSGAEICTIVFAHYTCMRDAACTCASAPEQPESLVDMPRLCCGLSTLTLWLLIVGGFFETSFVIRAAGSTPAYHNQLVTACDCQNPVQAQELWCRTLLTSVLAARLVLVFTPDRNPCPQSTYPKVTTPFCTPTKT